MWFIKCIERIISNFAEKNVYPRVIKQGLSKLQYFVKYSIVYYVDQF